MMGYGLSLGFYYTDAYTGANVSQQPAGGVVARAHMMVCSVAESG